MGQPEYLIAKLKIVETIENLSIVTSGVTQFRAP